MRITYYVKGMMAPNDVFTIEITKMAFATRDIQKNSDESI